MLESVKKMLDRLTGEPIYRIALVIQTRNGQNAFNT